ncbi:MAG: riboflavin synthase [Planctomycetota bacterium]
MFTGVVQAVGTVVGVEATPRRHADGSLAHRLDIDLGGLAEGLVPGASVAVNGACLTIASPLRGSVAAFDVVPETWRRTTLRNLQANTAVNLERALRAGDPLDGHFVQGHVEGLATVMRIERGGGEWKLWTRVPPELMGPIVPKGSITLDGVSLTVVDVDGASFSVALVPTTLQRTVFGRRQPGDEVNVETDILARLVIARLAALMPAQAGARTGGDVTWDKLREAGFIS